MLDLLVLRRLNPMRFMSGLSVGNRHLLYLGTTFKHTATSVSLFVYYLFMTHPPITFSEGFEMTEDINSCSVSQFQIQSETYFFSLHPLRNIASPWEMAMMFLMVSQRHQ